MSIARADNSATEDSQTSLATFSPEILNFNRKRVFPLRFSGKERAVKMNACGSAKAEEALDNEVMIHEE